MKSQKANHIQDKKNIDDPTISNTGIVKFLTKRPNLLFFQKNIIIMQTHFNSDFYTGYKVKP